MLFLANIKVAFSDTNCIQRIFSKLLPVPGGKWVATIHVEGRSQEPEACDEAGGTDNVHLTADVAILDTTRVTLEVA